MNPEHPKAIEAAERAAALAKSRAEQKAIIQELHSKGVRWVEVQPISYTGITDTNAGRMTIAYLPLGRHTVAISTALCHPEDKFDKFQGRARAGATMASGHCIVLRRPSNYETNRDWLRAKFTEYVA